METAKLTLAVYVAHKINRNTSVWETRFNGKVVAPVCGLKRKFCEAYLHTPGQASPSEFIRCVKYANYTPKTDREIRSNTSGE